MKLLIFACLVAYVSAHACLVSPEQTGGYPSNALNTQGADACGLTTAPCGGKTPSDSISYYKGGMTYNVTFQKNLDHFYKSDPGSWSLNLWKGSTQTATLLKIADPSPDKVGTGDFVTVPIKMPDVRDTEQYLLQLVYETNNPDVKKLIFYQCASITVMK